MAFPSMVETSAARAPLMPIITTRQASALQIRRGVVIVALFFQKSGAGTG
jgi:hypothetical protein